MKSSNTKLSGYVYFYILFEFIQQIFIIFECDIEFIRLENNDRLVYFHIEREGVILKVLTKDVIRNNGC